MNPLQKLQRANDDYHEAVDEILADENVLTNAKVEFGCIVNTIFAKMTEANAFIASYYGES
jgi:hypothetical protein